MTTGFLIAGTVSFESPEQASVPIHSFEAFVISSLFSHKFSLPFVSTFLSAVNTAKKNMPRNSLTRNKEFGFFYSNAFVRPLSPPFCKLMRNFVRWQQNMTPRFTLIAFFSPSIPNISVLFSHQSFTPNFHQSFRRWGLQSVTPSCPSGLHTLVSSRVSVFLAQGPQKALKASSKQNR